ncbi:MAG: SurA N-terminal domain-containing protein [Methylococcaceae bacterium]|nr:SurA N-terminal domain-containing protein [Methylococcaceae bacterium]
MLLKIREKSKGVFSWIILILICVPFALWGIQNYVGGGTEAAVASVGDKDFYQEDLNRAYSQYSQNLAGMDIDESSLKKQALEKLIQDEVLFQHVENEGLVVADSSAKKFIKELEYFQTDGKFDKKQYKTLLASQRLSSGEFVNRIKKALMMEQFQRTVIESSFATDADIENFFKIQNQTRDVELVSVALPQLKEQPSADEIQAYYQKNKNMFLTEEQVSVEYVELSLDELAKKEEPTSEQLKTYYDEQKEQYTTKERRKISHILFAFTKDSDDDKVQLEKALKAKEALQNTEFSVLAKELSDDKLTAAKGGDLGLFNIGVMEKAFEDVASSLELGEVSEPVKSGFGYHLIKVTELKAGTVKSFDSVKDELAVAFQRSLAENTFYEMGESLTEMSYENPDSLKILTDELGLAVKKTSLFDKKIKPDSSDKLNILNEPAIIDAAFSEDVLKGNNSQPIEIGTDRLVVLRMIEHQEAKAKELEKVKPMIVATLLKEKAKKAALEKAEAIKNSILSGKTMQAAIEGQGLKVKKISTLTRSNRDIAWQVNQGIFKAAKPIKGKTTVLTVEEPSGAQTVVNIVAVKEGVMTKDDKSKVELAKTNMAKAFGQSEFTSIMESLRNNTEIKFKAPELN